MIFPKITFSESLCDPILSVVSPSTITSTAVIWVIPLQEHQAKPVFRKEVHVKISQNGYLELPLEERRMNDAFKTPWKATAGGGGEIGRREGMARDGRAIWRRKVAVKTPM